MKLSQLMNTLSAGNRLPNTQVRSVTCDSRQVEKGSVFVCIKGQTSDGHVHLAEALERGAAVVVCQKDCGLPNQILVADSREAYARLCAAFFAYPARQMKLLAVTGTNGKTTTAWLIEQALSQMGKKTGLIGTICNKICAQSPGEPALVLPAHYTTPDPWVLQGLLRRMADRGCEYVVMEVSSHALAQKRLEACQFLCGVFTNLTPEHLDFHKSMENYYQTKKKLFSACRFAAINVDDLYGRRLAKELAAEQPLRFSVGDSSAELWAQQLKVGAGGSCFTLVSGEERAEVGIPLPGEFSVSNALAAAAALQRCGSKLGEIAFALSQSKAVPGRTQLLYKQEFIVMRDYAHTVDGLEKVLSMLRKLTPGRVLTVFGCPGRRDTSARPAMASVVARLSDLVVMTADNPREEPLAQIFEDARPGLDRHKTKYKIFEDRKEAIYFALDCCRKGDTLLLAGKGHEEYQVLSDRTICFDECQIVQEYFREK